MIIRTSLGIAATMFFLSASTGFAEQNPSADTVLVSVNGKNVTLGHVILAVDNLPARIKQFPDEVLFPGVLDQLTQWLVLQDSFSGELPASITYDLENYMRQLTANHVVAEILESEVTDDLIQAAYDTKFSDKDLGEEYLASHILVDTKEEADKLLQELGAGAAFSDLAKEHSTGPSGPGGGSLGWFRQGDMVPAFDAAVTSMEVGEVSQPVQTQFGWHIIQLNETRHINAPLLEEVRGDLIDEIGQDLLNKHVEELLDASKVERLDTTDFDLSIIRNLNLLDE